MHGLGETNISIFISVYILNMHGLGETNSLWIRYSILPFYILLVRISTLADQQEKNNTCIRQLMMRK